MITRRVNAYLPLCMGIRTMSSTTFGDLQVDTGGHLGNHAWPPLNCLRVVRNAIWKESVRNEEGPGFLERLQSNTECGHNLEGLCEQMNIQSELDLLESRCRLALH